MKIEIEREDDGRWLAEVPDLPGVMAYGERQEDAIAKVESLALRVLADRLDHGEEIPELRDMFAVNVNPIQDRCFPSLLLGEGRP